MLNSELHFGQFRGQSLINSVTILHRRHHHLIQKNDNIPAPALNWNRTDVKKKERKPVGAFYSHQS